MRFYEAKSTPVNDFLANLYYRLPPSLRGFLMVSCLLTVASLLSALLWRSFGYGLPYSSAYYFVPQDLFQDFQGFRSRFFLFGTPAFFTKYPFEYAMYPAPLLFPIAAFVHAQHPIRVFLIFTLGCVTAAAVLLYVALRSRGLERGSAGLFTAVVLITSYPVLFLLQRGNLEVLVWIPTTLGLVCFKRNYFTRAAMLFGLAAALKLYPLIFLSLLLIKRRYRDSIIALSVAVGVDVVALWKLGPTLHDAFHWNSIQLQAFSKYFAASTWALGYDHSFLLDSQARHYRAPS